ncbi:MAG: hypothetical protein LBS06_01060 [Treponema sp.]|jgi:hypothetical protein|nr:hypothetical protein [Treponema sp.]
MLALWLMPPGTAAGYAALRFDAAVPDRRIGELLSAVTEDYISESTQYVLLDDFGALREIPLDRYAESVEPFDPRNDGYAEKLRAFFVRDGSRVFFVPLAKLPGGRAAGGFAGGREAAFERRIAPLFEGIPFSVEYAGRGKPVLLWFVLAAAAGVGALFLWKPRLPAAASLPVLCAFAPGGPPALALGAILAGFLFLLVEPAGEFFVSFRYGGPRSGSRPGGRIAGNLRPFRRRLVPGALLLAAYGGGCAAGGVPPLLGAAVFAAALGLVILSLLAESVRGGSQDHVRFLPVIITKPPNPVPAFSRIVLAQFLGAALAASLPLLFPGLRPAAAPALFTGGALPSEEEYLRHAAFQAGFSWRPLGGGEGIYRRYTAGEDGLLSELPGEEKAAPSFPPFPLRDLAAFLDDPAAVPGPRPFEEGAGPLRQLPLLVALVLALPALRGPAWGRSKKKKMLVYAEKRIAA